MTDVNESRRVAVLLSSLGNELATTALEGVSGDRAKKVRECLEDFEENPPRQTEINKVLDDFELFLKFALRSANGESRLTEFLEDLEEESQSIAEAGQLATADTRDAKNPGLPSKSKPGKGKDAPQQPIRIFDPTGDPFVDILELTPAQVSGALHSEHPQTIGLILSTLSSEQLAETVDLLPEEKQTEAFFLSRNCGEVNQSLLERVLKKTVEQAILIEPDAAQSDDDDKKTAQLLRAMPKKTRSRLMEELASNDPDKANRLQEMLYVFEDISKYDNRSVQKLLGQCDTQVLVVALQDADPEVSKTVFNNLSKRAANGLREEMELKPPSSEDDVEKARGDIATLIANLDRSGELNER